MVKAAKCTDRVAPLSTGPLDHSTRRRCPPATQPSSCSSSWGTLLAGELLPQCPRPAADPPGPLAGAGRGRENPNHPPRRGRPDRLRWRRLQWFRKKSLPARPPPGLAVHQPCWLHFWTCTVDCKAIWESEFCVNVYVAHCKSNFNEK